MRLRQDSPYDLTADVVQQTAANNPSEFDRQVADLQRRFGDLQGADLIRAFVAGDYRGRMALTSSFGAESAVLLHMVARVDPSIPVLFLDTGKLFEETLTYRDDLVARLGLTDVRTLTPADYELEALDPDGTLHRSAPDQCCFIRKVAPLDRAIGGVDVWITGRKAFHSGNRADLSAIEPDNGRIKINPLLGWRPTDIDAYMERHALPPHPLVREGFLSIGCAPCTDRTRPGEDPRAGRWRGCAKTECGIHGPRDVSGAEGGGS